MVLNTRGIVLRTVKYGDTSIICSIFTEQFGLQSYLVKGVRTEKKKNQKANLLRPGNCLDMLVYHQPGKNLQFIKEFSPAINYQNIGEHIIKNSIVVFCVEILSNLLIEHNEQQILFEFCIDFFEKTDHFPTTQLANFPIYFLVQASKIMGYAIQNNYNERNTLLNTYEGAFSPAGSAIPPFYNEIISEKAHRIIATEQLSDFINIALDSDERRLLLEGFLHFMQAHDNNFKPLKSLPILQSILH